MEINIKNDCIIYGCEVKGGPDVFIKKQNNDIILLSEYQFPEKEKRASGQSFTIPLFRRKSIDKTVDAVIEEIKRLNQ